MQSFHIDTIGTHLEILLDENESEGTKELFGSIQYFLEVFEQKYSRFIAENWLDKINTSRSGILDEHGYKMLSFALEVAKKTGGYFDPTIAGQLSTLGYGRIEHQNKGIGWEKVYLDKVKREVLLSGDVILEFGGVGKGYLIDCIKKHIDDFFSLSGEKKRYIINFGGDIYGSGDWKVGLENPYNSEEAIGIIVLHDDFLACSAGNKRKWNNNHHLINPHEGVSAYEVTASFIEGISGIETDSYATALSVMPYMLACEFLEKERSIEGVLIGMHGQFFQSSGSRAEIFTQ